MIDVTWSRVGLGCWQLGDDCWGAVDEDRAFTILHEAVDHGVTLFDTADVYGSGLSEERIGRFLAETKAKAFVATKIGRFGDPGWPANFTRDAMRRHVDACRRRLGVDALDLVQLHCVPLAELVRGEVFDHLREMQEEGAIHAWGASIESVEEGLLCLTQPGIAALQVIVNVLRQRPIGALIPRAHQMGVKILARLPLASGVLSGRMTRDTRFAANDHRGFNADGAAFHVGETFNGLGFENALAFADRLKADLPEGMTLHEAAMRWLLDQPGITSIIPGASKIGQAAANAATVNLSPLPDQLHARWAKLYREEVAPVLRGQV